VDVEQDHALEYRLDQLGDLAALREAGIIRGEVLDRDPDSEPRRSPDQPPQRALLFGQSS
jgi:hypothetical protein